MAIFTEKGHGVPETETGLSIIGTGMRVVGDVTAEGVVKIEGTVVGTVRAGRQVLVAKGGEVEGDVITRVATRSQELRRSPRPARTETGRDISTRDGVTRVDSLSCCQSNTYKTHRVG